jgi:demethylmenaquinone methyltransferase/2-methoxy-6-polyprenyl-1,4-benzoquinol methylase
MVEAKGSTPDLKRAYNLYSRVYGPLVAQMEKKSRLRALDLAGISASDRVLEVAVGSGNTFLEMAQRRGTSVGLTGLDLSPRMLEVTRRRLSRKGFSGVDLREGDARHLPFPDGKFDVLFNSYMLDLVPLRELGTVLREFDRVLGPGGRLILVNMSKRDPSEPSWYERFYQSTPAWFATFLLGGCRPVVMEHMVREMGYVGIRREFHAFPMFSEIIIGEKGHDRTKTGLR